MLVQLRFLQGNSFISLSCVGVWLWRTSIRYGSAAFILLLITLVVPPIFCYRFQPASLASLLFINFQFRFILVVGSLLSPLDLCNTPSSSFLANLVWYVFVGFRLGHGCWVNIYDCIWLAKFPSLLCIEIGGWQPGWNLLYLCLFGRAYNALLVVPFFHNCLRLLVLAGMHPVYLVGSLWETFSSSVKPLNGMTTA